MHENASVIVEMRRKDCWYPLVLPPCGFARHLSWIFANSSGVIYVVILRLNIGYGRYDCKQGGRERIDDH